MKKIVITKVPLQYYFYYQWLILGLHQLNQEKEIVLKIKLKSPVDIILCSNFKIFLGLRKYLGLFKAKKMQKKYLLEGYFESNGKKQQFVYDIADTPYFFNQKKLNEDVCYFKAQCPTTIDEKGFSLTPDIYIPFHPVVLENTHKIVPSMLAPGGWCYNIYSYNALHEGYKTLFVNNIKKDKTLMCYFGGNKGPKPEFSYNPDLYLEESHILSFFRNLINHPNEKRAKAAQIISSLGENYDGRIIKVFNEDGQLEKHNQESFIPLKDYTRHIARFQYNLNISGYRKSIPNRFIYSFCVGTAIVTDKLSVKWYQPFDQEVVELKEMGYIPNDQVDWSDFEQNIRNLPDVSREKVIENFQTKWSPKAFATYIVNECEKTLNTK